jgi:hypothetical protein
MTKQSKALQMAVNALTTCSRFEEAIQACKEVLEQPSWQGLNDAEIFNLSQQCDLNHILGLIDYGRAVEQALKEKNDV